MQSGRACRGFTLVELLVVLAIIGILMGLTLVGVQRVREAASRLRCLSNLRQIGLALHGYHGAHGRFPPGVSYADGKDPYPFMSWQTRLLPFVEQDPLWLQSQQAYAVDKDFRVNPPHVGFATVLPLYTCPSDPRTFAPADVFSLRVAFTDYLGNEGINFLRKDGVLFLDSAVRFTDVTDGTSSTLFVGERPPSANWRMGWWYGGMGQNDDGSVDEVLGVREKNFTGWAGTCPRGPYEYGPGRDTNLCDMFHFWSHHSGGANFLFVDGSAHFLAYAAAPVMPALATRSGGEAVEVP
jgi:prepilin-type N-terminal cleavage/methylation domain-containing protein/prepilin-type processing-associated H-X9-DG protein